MSPELDPLEVFGPALRGNSKTYITAAIGLVTMVLSGFGVVNLTEKQLTAMTGAILMVAFIFQRLAVWKAQKAAAAASIAAAKTLSAVKEVAEATPAPKKPRGRPKKASTTGT